MYKQDLAFNNLEGLMYFKIQPTNQQKQFLCKQRSWFKNVTYKLFAKVWFSLGLWHFNHCRLFNVKSSLYIYIYIYILDIYDLV